jgi:hypothetical protein
MVMIMKNTFKYIAAAAAALLALSCQKEAMDKPEVEAGFAPKGPVPTVSIDATSYKIVEEEGYAEVKVTYTGITEAMDSLELGVLVSLQENFLSSTPIVVEETADGTYTVKVPVRPAQVNYVKATVATISGSAYSETLILDVPSVPWYKMIASSYSGDAYSYWDEGSCSYPGHTVGVKAEETAEGNIITFTDFCPFATSKGFPSVVTAVFDVETRVASIPLDEYGMFDAGLSPAGIFAVPMNTDFDAVDYMTVTFSEDYSQMGVQCFGEYSDAGWYEITLPTVYAAN